MGLTLSLRSHWERYAIFQYFWIIILLPKALQLIVLGGLACLAILRTDRKLRIDGFALLQILCLVIYALSILRNSLLGTHETSRIFAACNTWAINLVAVLLYLYFRHMELDYRRIGKYCFINLLILVGLWIVFEITDGAKLMIWGQQLSDDDWIHGLLDARFMGFLDYSNLIVFLVLFFYPMALVYLSKKRIMALGLTILMFPVISATNSRTGLVLVAVLFAAYILFELQYVFFRIYRRHRPATVVLGILAVAGIMLIAFDLVLELLEKFISIRAGSNSMRTFLYTESFTMMLNQSPVIGIGIKDMLYFPLDNYAVQEYALGSHSTYLGMFYKIGLLGGSLYMISLVVLLTKILKSRDKDNHFLMLKICILAALMMMILEDVDGANWTICIFYILLAIVQNPGWNSGNAKIQKKV